MTSLALKGTAPKPTRRKARKAHPRQAGPIRKASATKAKVKNPRGRPPAIPFTPENLKQIEGLARIQCTMAEAAGVFRCHVDTFGDFLRAHPEAREAWDNGRESGRASLRRDQFKMAEKNASMSIWLGKQYLGQKDSLELGGDPNNPLQIGGKVEFVIVKPKPQREPGQRGGDE